MPTGRGVRYSLGWSAFSSGYGRQERRRTDAMADAQGDEELSEGEATASASPLVVGGLAPDVTLPDQDGAPVAFSALWARQPTVFVFLRHFG